ncbi:hypothetical protein KIN20_005321 [Parelaphostrongylus tenuis]|uniref:Uncharacterized protein n=1 Tax=Parelaphostrongylus tenuis TaxID=148309 RepID=A0AAD5MIE6_PARTN|nr:hypothetical protein KIN20_005321 [Parelaphostrongylus tenuis]
MSSGDKNHLTLQPPPPISPIIRRSPVFTGAKIITAKVIGFLGSWIAQTVC